MFDQIAIIGYNGNIALVDKEMSKKIAKMNVAQLLEAGNYKAAFALAVLKDDDAAKMQVAQVYSQLASHEYKVDDLPRLFGVYQALHDYKLRKI
jgi:hypothetical protein